MNEFRMSHLLSVTVLLALAACQTPPATTVLSPTVTLSSPATASQPTPTVPRAPTNTIAPLPTETPIPATALPPATIVSTSCATPVSVTTGEGQVSYHGMSFSYDPALAISFMAQDCPSIPYQEGTAVSGFFVAHTLFTAPAYNQPGTYLELGIKVVAINEENMQGDNGWIYPPLVIISDLQKMLTAQPQPSPWFDRVALHVRPRYLDFQNGTGVRAVVEYNQDIFFFTNNDLLYAFDGLTRDGRYYVGVRIPIDAPFLINIDGPDPCTNTNPQAIPIPNCPSDYYADMEAYNQEALRRFDQMADSDFTPSLTVLDALVASLLIEPTQ